MVPNLSYILMPLIACTILVAIHVYLGLHVLRRGVIFVDIAIAQIAALGLTFSFYMGFDPQSTVAHFYALSFAFGGAALFAFAKTEENNIPQEAIIGICYVVSAGLAILLVDMANDPHGSEKIRYLLVGNLAWVTKADIWKMLYVYVPIGIFHGIFYKKFYSVSFEPEKSKERGISNNLWDFLFYFTFGIVVTSSVKVCGVLLVFSFLVIPSTCVSLFVQKIPIRLFLSWTLGIGVSFLGLLFSWSRPSGPTIIFFFAVLLILCSVLKYIISSSKKLRAILLLSSILGGFLLVLWTIGTVGAHYQTSKKHGHLQKHIQRPVVTTKKQDLQHTPKKAKKWIQKLFIQVKKLDFMSSEEEIENICQQCPKKKRSQLAKAFLQLLTKEKDESLQLNVARLLLLLQEKQAIPYLLEILETSKGSFRRETACNSLQKYAGLTFGYDPNIKGQKNQKALNKWKKWWKKNSKNPK